MGACLPCRGCISHFNNSFQGGVAIPVQGDKKVRQIGNLVNTGKFKNPQRGRVYSPNGISPTLNTCGGGGLEVKILTTQDQEGGKMLIKEATAKGYAEAKPGDSVNISFPNSKTRRGRVEKGKAGTLMTSCDQAVVLPCTDENLVIRKLTPREYARLQGFSDETFNRLKGLSNTQLYKIFGNSITVDVPKKAFLLQALICLPGFTDDHSCVNCENCVHAGNNEFYCDVKFKLLAEKGHSTKEYEEDCKEWELKKSIKEVLAIAKAKTKKE